MNWLKKLFKKKELEVDIPEEDLLILMGINPPEKKKNKLPSTYWTGYNPYISVDREDFYNSINSGTDQHTTNNDIQFDGGSFGGAGASGSWESDDTPSYDSNSDSGSCDSSD